MKKRKLLEAPIYTELRQMDATVAVAEVTHALGIIEQTYYL